MTLSMIWRCIWATGITTWLFSSCATDSDKGPPNIILIMGDDMGYSDLGCYGSGIRTPNLDQLAADGIRYTHFYNSARCCPTRASLLTGLYPHQAGIGHMMSDRGTTAFRGDLSKNAVTIAEVLKSAGYSTYMSGKWHVTPYWSKDIENQPRHNWPTNRGFDRFFGTILGAGSLYDPASLAHNLDFIPPGRDFYYTDAITDFAIECIEEHEGEEPYFLYVSHVAAHWPLHAPEEDINKYDGQFDQGWDETRALRLQRMKQLGLIDDEVALSSRDSRIPDWSDTLKHRHWHARNMEVYAAMIDRMDQGIGRIIETLQQNGTFENTLIFFLQDNGGCAEELDWITSTIKPDDLPLAPDSLQTRMVPLFTRDGLPVSVQNPQILAGSAYSYHAYGKYWANVSNTPFRMYKHWVHEGGIATPLIAHWPEGIGEPGGFRAQPTHLIDIMATCVDVGNATYPTQLGEHKIIAMEGQSLRPTFGGSTLTDRALFWEHEGNRAVRQGDWKLVSRSEFNAFVWDRVDTLRLSDWELYNIRDDRNELTNLASMHEGRVAEMATAWQAWARRTGAVPRPTF